MSAALNVTDQEGEVLDALEDIERTLQAKLESLSRDR